MIIYVCLTANEKDEPILRVVEDSKVNNLTRHDILLTSGFGLHLANYTLRLLDTGIDIKFENFKQYDRLIKDVNEIVTERAKKMYNLCESVKLAANS
ncbi:hypothetical protein [Haloimpatiens lingqiaonensis]|uniref:hypothetical protein n=1 Tax=Haloimpatiens lingqiaonensis TaxID=1380675 RepID=UPI0010FD17DA|nr:hypothetical protein [Haloimpatiens lingqiaonensis]